MSGKVALGCGCCFDAELGFPLAYCKAHDRRTRAVRVAAALQDLGKWLDEGARTSGQTASPFGISLANAAKAAVKAAKAMVDDVGRDEFGNELLPERGDDDD